MITTQGSIPEVREDVLGEAIKQRAYSIKDFHDLGPPDLVSLTKSVPGSKTPEVGTYLYYTGLDNSSPSAVAAHLNQVANIIGATPQSWFGKLKNFKVTKAVHTSYNAFSKNDVIVNVNLPGNVSTYVLNAFGERLEADDQIWREVFASAVVRSLVSSEDEDDQVSSVVESRKLQPFSTIDLAKLFFDAFEALFFQGQNLGSAPEIQTPTLISNYLVDAFLKAVELTQLYDYALDILGRLREKEESVVSLIVKVLFLKDEEIKAVQTLYDGIKKNPRDASLLVIQSELLSDKGKLDLALASAIRAVNSVPSEFNPWSNLSKLYLKLGDIENSLLTLNACPMAGYKEKFQLKRVVSSRPEQLHLPFATDVNIEEVQKVNSKDVAAEHETVDQSLLNLQAANLKSTFAKAYDILTGIVHEIGWEALLKYRGKIFVMEEEYSKSQTPSTVNLEKEAEDEKSFKKKRLCERWLDNLFMLLYEDLKVYTMWQAESIHFQAQKTQYTKVPLEWEHLGITAFRLKHFKEAAGAFQLALDGRFSSTSTRYLLRYYQLETKSLKKRAFEVQNSTSNGNNAAASSTSVDHVNLSPQQISKKLSILDEKTVDAVVKLSAWNHRWYCEFSPFLLGALSKVVEREGLVKAQSQIKADFPESTGAYELLQDSFSFLTLFQVPGSDA